jgi:hypothetical protein
MNKHEIITRLVRAQTEEILDKNLRRGQYLFILLYSLSADIANDIRSTEYDCFYDDDKIDGFMKRVAELLAPFP